MHPVERQNYAASAMICVPASLNENGPALGAQVDEKKNNRNSKIGRFFKVQTSDPDAIQHNL